MGKKRSDDLPYEKFLQKGAESLTDAELLAILLRTGPVPGPDAWFERFWAAYPNQRCGKSSALKAWRKIKPSPALAEAIVAAVERQKGWEQWKRDGGRYIPMATTWLNQCRWDAEDAKPEGGEQNARQDSFD